MEMANELGADLAVVTGDFITGANDPFADCIDEIQPTCMRRWVFGDVTAITKSTPRLKILAQSLFAQAGMKLLRQENAQLSFKGAYLQPHRR